MEVTDGFVKHVGQQMLDRDYVKQPQTRKQVQNTLKGRMQEVGLCEGQFVQNRLKIHNYLNLSRVEPFFVKPNYIPQIVQMNVVQMETRLFGEFTPSSRMPRMMSGILHGENTLRCNT